MGKALKNSFWKHFGEIYLGAALIYASLRLRDSVPATIFFVVSGLFIYTLPLDSDFFTKFERIILRIILSASLVAIVCMISFHAYELALDVIALF